MNITERITGEPLQPYFDNNIIEVRTY